MRLNDAHHHFETPHFEDRLFSELYQHENDLPLQDFCRDGCPASESQLELSDLKLNEPCAAEVVGTFRVGFKEYVYRGCRDIEWNDPVSGTVKFTLGVKTGVIEFEADTAPEREPDQL